MPLMGVTVGDLARQVSGTLRGDAACPITGAQALRKAAAGDITFAADEKNLLLLKSTSASAVFVSVKAADKLADAEPHLALIFVADPFEAFLSVLKQFRPVEMPPDIGISSQATIHPTATLGENCHVFPGAYIGPHVTLGRDCIVHPGVVIEEHCTLGDGCRLFPNAVLYPHVILGQRVIIHANAVLGADGFGYRFRNGAFQKIPQLGWVIVEDDVEIGAAATIDRGMIGPTIIGQGTKIDNLVMIGHNCEIGKHNAFASQVGFAGSVTTGDYVRCAGQVGVADHVHLGTNCVLGAKAGVHKDMEGDKTYIGIPALEEREQFRLVMAIKKIPELRQQVKALESQLERLQEQLKTSSSLVHKEAA